MLYQTRLGNNVNTNVCGIMYICYSLRTDGCRELKNTSVVGVLTVLANVKFRRGECPSLAFRERQRPHGAPEPTATSIRGHPRATYLQQFASTPTLLSRVLLPTALFFCILCTLSSFNFASMAFFFFSFRMKTIDTIHECWDRTRCSALSLSLSLRR